MMATLSAAGTPKDFAVRTIAASAISAARLQPPAGFEHHVAKARLDSTRIEVVAGLHGPVDHQPISVAPRLFDHDHRVRAFRQRRAGHNLNRVTRFDAAGKNFARANFADDSQLTRRSGGAQRKSIPGRARERRIIAVGGDLLRQNAPRRIERRHLLYRAERLHFAQHALARLFET